MAITINATATAKTIAELYSNCEPQTWAQIRSLRTASSLPFVDGMEVTITGLALLHMEGGLINDPEKPRLGVTLKGLNDPIAVSTFFNERTGIDPKTGDPFKLTHDRDNGLFAWLSKQPENWLTDAKKREEFDKLLPKLKHVRVQSHWTMGKYGVYETHVYDLIP